MYSEPNTAGATIRVEPAQVSTLREGIAAIESEVDSNTNEGQIRVIWDELTTKEETGDSEITSYNLLWDQGNNGFTWYSLVGSVSDSLITDYIVSDPHILPG